VARDVAHLAASQQDDFAASLRRKLGRANPSRHLEATMKQRKTPLAFSGGLTVLLLAAACDTSRSAPAPPASAPPTLPSASAAVGDAAWHAEVARLRRSLAAELSTRQTRVADAKFLGFSKTGEKQARFAITSRTQKTIEWAQAWVYYYSAEGNYLDRCPDTFETKIKPQGRTEQALGYPGQRIPEGTATAECEISVVEYADGSTWANENLEQAGKRKPGGPSSAELMRLEGEVVVGKWTGRYGESQRPVFWLTNISGRPLQTRMLWTFYYGKDGQELDRELDRQTLKLPAGATIEAESGDLKGDIEQGTQMIEIAVSAVSFEDGKKEKWSNENLSRATRPMRAAAE
jgi:hypothetical protein